MIQTSPKFSSSDIWNMAIAFEQAEKAFSNDEVPVGAIIVDKHNRIISRAFNEKEKTSDPCAHAEILAIKRASEYFQNWRLSGCRLYVTLEPCIMCMGAVVNSRIDTLVFGAYDPKGGAISLGFNLHQNKLLNHRFNIIGGVDQLNCSRILSNFFKQKRSFYKK